MGAELFLIGTGPGDSELLTLKAQRILGAIDCVAYPQKPGEKSLSYAIAEPALNPAAERLVIDMPIAVERAPAQDAYDIAAAEIEKRLNAGKSVAYLCEGDPLFYGSAMYLLDRLRPLASISVVPGVTSLSASAAASHRPLAARNEIFKVLPAPLEDAVLEREMLTADSVAIIKIGRHFPRIRALLDRMGLLMSSAVVTAASQEGEHIRSLIDTSEEALPYFSTVLAYRGREPWAESLPETTRFAETPSPAEPPPPTIEIVAPPAPRRREPGQKPAIVLFTTAGAATASTIATATGGRVHALGPGQEGARELVSRLFSDGTPIVGVCAAGILVRLLAGAPKNKQVEPPVIAVSADGAHVVPLLGGHHGGNALARDLAEALGGTAAVTTASDTRFTRGLDEPPQGYELVAPERAKEAMARVLDGERLSLTGSASWLEEAGYPLAPNGTVKVAVSPRLSVAADLVFRPKVLVAGIGCERGASAAEIMGLLTSTLADRDLSPDSLAAIASIDLKGDEAALNQVAAELGVPLRLFTAEELAKEEARLENPSEIVRAEVGTPGVAEAAALKAGALLVPKRRSARATCAIGLASEPVDVESFGRSRGVLHIVGIGPGEPHQRTESAVRALDVASDWVGYGLYLDLIADLQSGQTEHRFPLGDEEKRVRHALELAAEGKSVALISSGDAQIYAMASLVFELLEAEGKRAVSDAARRVEIACHPGISALQMASARAGALIGHDFCAVSLSDLLTPAKDIRKRLGAAALGDFVTALYNPRSGKRTELLNVAKRFFLAYRPKETPVIVAANLGRAGEKVTVTTLDEFDPKIVDMLTIVLIGSSNSRILKRGDGTVAFTPRGYEKKSGKSDKSGSGKKAKNT